MKSTIVIPYSDTTTWQRFLAALAAQTTQCLRDQAGNLAFGRVLDYGVTENVGFREVTFLYSRSQYNEAV
jgi:hypothetical protein